MTKGLPLSPAARVALLARNMAKHAAGLASVALARSLGSRANGSPGILVYHRIAWPVRGIPYPTINVAPNTLQAQITGLLARGYQIWPLGRLLDAHASGGAVPPRTLAITFDDGYGNVFTRAFPVLRALGVPATVFLNTAYLDADLFPFDPWARTCRVVAPPESYRPLAGDECREMLASGLVELGAHTHTHRNLAHDPDAFRADLQQSVDTIRERFGVGAMPFAFPWGRPHLGFVTDALVEAAKATGVTCGLTTRNVPVDLTADPFGWGRFNAFPFDSAATLAAKLDGWYGWAPWIQERCAAVGRRVLPGGSGASAGGRG